MIVVELTKTRKAEVVAALDFALSALWCRAMAPGPRGVIPCLCSSWWAFCTNIIHPIEFDVDFMHLTQIQIT
ncbi:hypothetical protein K505DRAFT_127447 [Melanomma pulvis-pyrius CBS 109.77]|uniref:Uncharacterized protein n=1 Tax=Melanomma pulvis-pyrius CBS 109.77 TaxID=1314802 RepID=A0A6A6XNW2_9PLEO|nr:hypothetical protein K505DRAFT_127447 [Melanomma pulvis-pyrius CBS 109.77]